MKNKIKEIIKKSKRKLINVRLDHSTIMTLSRMSSLKTWLKRYPEAKVITS